MIYRLERALGTVKAARPTVSVALLGLLPYAVESRVLGTRNGSGDGGGGDCKMDTEDMPVGSHCCSRATRRGRTRLLALSTIASAAAPLTVTTVMTLSWRILDPRRRSAAGSDTCAQIQIFRVS